MKKILVLALFGLIVFSTAAQDLNPNLEQAEILFEDGELDKALESVELYLVDYPDNSDARRLKKNIEQGLSAQLSADLTYEALDLIEGGQFAEAKTLVEQALIANPGNAEAMDLYVSLSRISTAENAVAADLPATPEPVTESPTTTSTTVVTTATTTAATVAVVTDDTDDTATTETATTTEDTATSEDSSSADTESEDKDSSGDEAVGEDEGVESDSTSKTEKTLFGFTASPMVTFANSNYLTLDSRVSLLGIGLGGWVYLPVWENRIGFSLDYTGNFLKLSGNDAIDFTTHRFVASTIIRTWVFESEGNSTTIGGKVNYSWFTQQTKDTDGAYLLVDVYGLGLGGFIADPIFARFVSGEFVKNLDFSLGFDGYLGFGDTGTLFSFDLDFDATYAYNAWKFGLGYSLFGLTLDGTLETYQGIIIKTEWAY